MVLPEVNHSLTLALSMNRSTTTTMLRDADDVVHRTPKEIRKLKISKILFHLTSYLVLVVISLRDT